MIELTLWQWCGVFIRIYVSLWTLSGAVWFVWCAMGVSALVDLEWILDFQLPSEMFARKPLPHYASVLKVTKNG